MTTITEQAAQRYAAAVIDVLSCGFPAVKDNSLGRILPVEIARQAEAPLRSFELIVTYTREWRLIPADGDHQRVQLACFKARASHEESILSRRINSALRAIDLED
jgi:hypothetical protein